MGVIATRNESVRLSLEDNFTSGMARAAAATAILNKNLKDLDGTDVSGGLDETGESAEKAAKKTKEYSLELAVADEKAARLRKSLRDQAKAQLDAAEGIDRVGQSLEKLGSSNGKASADIDRFSGRLGLLVDAAIVGTPALVRLGAGTIPALTGAVAGLGAAAGGIGVAALAFIGLGDALTALNDYQLAPTAENLSKLRIEQEKLGPSGAQFVSYIDSLTPALSDLQNTARAGLFPGVEAGIDDLLTRLPEVKSVISDIAQGLGSLASDAGASLGGSDFDAFFEYLKSDARPTLDAFARSAGNVGLGLANLLVAFAPASRDFTGGLEDATKAFANFTKGLDDNAGFQSFLSYVRDAGPEVAQFAGAFVQAFAGIAQAAAPLGTVLLPALTGVLKALSAIATSPVGPAIYTSIAAFTALNRVSGLAGGALDRLSVSSDRTRSSLSRIASSGAGIVAAGQAIGLLVNSFGDLGNAVNSADIDRSITALTNGQSADSVNKLSAALQTINEAGAGTTNAIFSIGSAVTGIQTSFASSQDTVDKFDQSLASLVENGHADEAAAAFEKIRAAAAARGGVSDADVVKSFDAYNTALKNTAAAAGAAAPPLGFLQSTISNLANGAFAEATAAANDLTTALSTLSGFFDKRDAVLNYKDSVDALTKSLKNGFTREDEANLNAVGRSILQVAQNIKDPGAQRNFLEKAREQLLDMARDSGPKAAKAIREVTREFDKELKLTADPDQAEAAIKSVGRLVGTLGGKLKPIKLSADASDAQRDINSVGKLLGVLNGKKANPKVDANTAPAIKDFNTVGDQLTRIDRFTAQPRVTADVSAAVSAIASVRSLLTGLNGDSATTYVRSVRVAERSAEGSTVPKTGLGYADRHLYLLADGEEVISNKYGQADRNRPLLKAINANRLADGGSAFGSSSTPKFRDGGSDDIERSAKGAAGALKVLEVRAKRLENAQAKQEKKLDNLNTALDNQKSARDSLSSSTTSSLLHDPFGNGLAGLQAQTAADSADAQTFLTALQSLRGSGLDANSLLFQQLAASGDVNTATQLAGLSPAEIAAQQAAFQQRTTYSSAAGQFAGQQTFGDDVKEARKDRNEQRKVVHELTQQVKHLQAAIDRMGKHVEDGAERGAHKGTKEGQQDRNTTTSQRVRTGGGRR